MVNPKYGVFAAIVLGVCSVALLLCGVVAGLRHNGAQMGLCFFLGGHTAFCCVSFLLNMKIDSCFKRLGIHGTKPRTVVGGVLMVAVSTALMILAMLAALRRYWLLMCLLLSVFMIAFFIYDGVMIALKVDVGTKRLEELTSKEKDVKAIKEHSGEN